MPDVRCERLVVSGEHFIGGARIASHDTLEVCSVGRLSMPVRSCPASSGRTRGRADPPSADAHRRVHLPVSRDGGSACRADVNARPLRRSARESPAVHARHRAALCRLQLPRGWTRGGGRHGNAVRHGGASGCVLVCDPTCGIVVALTTNTHLHTGRELWTRRLHAVLNCVFADGALFVRGTR